MKTKLALALLVVTALSGCEMGGTDSASTDAGGGTGGGTATPTPTPAPTCVAGGGFGGNTYGFYISAGTPGSTFQTLNLSLGAHSAANNISQSVTVTAYQCGFGGTQLGTKTISTGTLNSSVYAVKAFTFTSAITVPTCSGGVGIIAFKVDTGDTSHPVNIGAANSQGSCTMRVSTDNSSTPPSPQSIWWAAATVQ